VVQRIRLLLLPYYFFVQLGVWEVFYNERREQFPGVALFQWCGTDMVKDLEGSLGMRIL